MAAEAAVKENGIEMRIMTTPLHRRRNARRRGRLAACLAAACVLLLVAASSALADTQWRITSVHGPQNMAPGGLGQYVLQVYNIGDTDSDGSPITVTDTLPAGLTATSAFGDGWDCSANAYPATTVVCTSANIVSAPSPTNILVRGTAPPLSVSVQVDPSVAEGAVADNAATVSGGSAPADASTTDATTFRSTPAGFGFVPGSFAADMFDAAFPAGSPVRQAGAHPFEARIDFRTNLRLREDPDDPQNGDVLYTEPDGNIKTLVTRMPRGLVGDPQATPQCDAASLNGSNAGSKGSCPANTQVGSIDLILSEGKRFVHSDWFSTYDDITQDVPVFNVAPPKGAIATLGFAINGNPVYILITLDPADYSIVATIKYQNDFYAVRSAQLTLWGVPADPAHNPLRVDGSSPFPDTAIGAASNAPLKPFLTAPSQCGVDGAVTMRADSWQSPGVFTPWQTGTTAQMSGCEDHRFRFGPTISVRPEVSTPSTPTGLDVDLSVPQKDDSTVTDASQLYAQSGDDRAIATPPLRDVSVTLPEGMSVSPSSADGLASCSSAQIALGTAAEPTCAEASKIGSAELVTPVLSKPVEGSIYLAAQSDNPFGSLLAVYIVLEDRDSGLMIKLPGKIAPDATTGQLTATFDDNPQLPFSDLKLRFKGGPRAPLVTPPTCGVKTSTATMTSWNDALPAVQTTDSFTIDGGCAKGFDPSFTAGTTNPVAGKDSPLVTRFGRTDADQELGAIDLSLPNGLLGRIASTVLCSDGAANAGACQDASKIGRATVAAGPGSSPFLITDGRVYVTGPYKGAPFGLSIVVHAKAGPLDLGNVVVRGSIFVDRTTAALRIVTDRLPTILQGIPLQLRLADVTIDRPGFMFNPTNCGPMSASARIASTLGTIVSRSVRFQVGDCAALAFAPQMSITVGSRHHTGRNVSTPLTATVRMGKGQANLRSVNVTLPTTLNAVLPVLNRACTLTQFRAGTCSSRARAGSAVAVTPLLRDPLRGSAYFVKNPKRVLPDLMVALRGQVAIDLTGKVGVNSRTNRLTTAFDTVPDVPIGMFSLRLVSGANGPVGATTNLCSAKARRATASLGFRAQNGAVVTRSQRLRIGGCPRSRHGRA
jgi:uncharacterized repeat protein (TIGR01451 family)